MTKDEYKAYLQSPAWKRTRKHKLEQAGNQCQLCPSAKDLQVHHRTYERIGNERLDDLIVLCDECHEHHHARLPELPPMANEALDVTDALARINRKRTELGLSA